MGFFSAMRGRRQASAIRGANPRVAAYLEAWARSHHGVEAYVEPRTMVTETTVVLIAHDGEWTRRRVPSRAAAYAFGRRLGIPVYDVHLVGYPNRMREYIARQKILARRAAMRKLES